MTLFGAFGQFTDSKQLNFTLKMARKDDKGFEEEFNSKTSKCQISVDLSESLKTCVKNVLNQIADEQFVHIYKACYKEFEKKDEVIRAALSGSSTEGKKYHSQFNEMIMRSTFKTIDETVLNLDNQLKELEELKLSQSNSNIFWRPPGNAFKHMLPFEYLSEIEKKKELEGKIEREQEVLSILKTRLNQKRNKAKELNGVLSSLIEDIREIVTHKINEEQSLTRN